MGSILGDIGGVVSDLFGGGGDGGGGNFLGELLSAFDIDQNNNGNNTAGQIAADVAPLLMAFL